MLEFVGIGQMPTIPGQQKIRLMVGGKRQVQRIPFGIATGSHALRGNPLAARPRRVLIPGSPIPARSIPLPEYGNQSLLPKIIPRAGVTPVLGPVEVTAIYGVIVNVIDLLAQHLFALDFLGVATFFPHLMFAVLFVLLLEKAQLLQDAPGALFFQVFDQAMGRIGLEAGKLLAERGRLGNHVQMVFQDYVGVKLEIAFLLAEAQGLENDLHGGRARKYWNPVEDGAGQEVRDRFVVDSVAVASHWVDSQGLLGYELQVCGAGAPRFSSHAARGNQTIRSRSSAAPWPTRPERSCPGARR